MDRTLRLLLVEDNEDDALLLMHRLEKEGYRIEADRVENGHDMTRLLNEKTYDLIVCDYSLPKFSGEHALDIFHQSGLDIPFILVSGTIGEDVAVGMMKLGAHDYIMKDNIRRIGPAVTRELAEAEIRRQRKQALEDLRLAKEKAEQ